MSECKPLRVLIADDEPLAAERLQLLLARAEGAQLVGTASDGDSATNLTEALHPDVLLLDIAMPGLDGIGVARALAGAEPLARRGIRHRLRPVRGRRLRGRGGRLSDEAGRSGPAAAGARPRAGLSAAPGRPAAPGQVSQWLEEFWASDLSGLVRIASRDVDRVSAERDYMRLHVGRRSWLIHHSMAALEEGLEPGPLRSAPSLGDRAQGLHRRLRTQPVRALDRSACRRDRAAGRTTLFGPRQGDRRPLAGARPGAAVDDPRQQERHG